MGGGGRMGAVAARRGCARRDGARSAPLEPSAGVGAAAPRSLCAWVTTALALVLLPGTACEQASDEPAKATSASRPTAPPPPTTDLLHRPDSLMALDAADVGHPAFASARREAVSRLEEARLRWTFGDDASRARWLIGWWAADETGPAELLWVAPLHWSQFRIEGTLRSRPADAQAPPPGSLVTFSADEVADWVCIHDDGSIEGGFVLRSVNTLRRSSAARTSPPAPSDRHEPVR